MPISNPVMSRAISRARMGAPTRPVVDPWITAGMALLALLAVWSASPIATGAPSVSSDLRIDLSVPVSTSVTPGWTSGDDTVRLANLRVPGDSANVSSGGWRMTTNWEHGYEVRLRSTTDPAMRGRNAVDGNAASDSFADFSTAPDCPCPWTTSGYTRGVFGYSVSVDTATGSPAPLETSRWLRDGSRLWRGLGPTSFRAYSTAGGAGDYTMTMHFRSAIPRAGSQREGSYRANVIASAHPLL